MTVKAINKYNSVELWMLLLFILMNLCYRLGMSVLWCSIYACRYNRPSEIESGVVGKLFNGKLHAASRLYICMHVNDKLTIIRYNAIWGRHELHVPVLHQCRSTARMQARPVAWTAKDWNCPRLSCCIEAFTMLDHLSYEVALMDHQLRLLLAHRPRSNHQSWKQLVWQEKKEVKAVHKYKSPDITVFTGSQPSTTTDDNYMS
jgi:hypothetical protein